MMTYKFMRFPGGKAKAFTMSYDDGKKSDMRFSDIITKHGLKCTFNLTGNELVHDLTDDEIRKYMLGRGHEIAVHGLHHIAEGTMLPIEGIQDVLNCRLELEDRFGIIIKGMAYPDTGITNICTGTTYQKIKNYLTELEIAYSRTLRGDNNEFNLPDDWHSWIPTAHHNNPKIMDYIEEFIQLDNTSEKAYTARFQPRLFYLWGHSYEFDRDDNWQHLEDICAKVSGREDIWYATNMEIYEYVKAYESLSFSANRKRVYNPTLIDVWFYKSGKIYKVASGETIELEK